MTDHDDPLAGLFDLTFHGEQIIAQDNPDFTVTIRKVDTVLPVSAELLGLVDAPDRPAPSRWQRLRWRLTAWWAHRPRVHFGPCPVDHDGWDD